MKNLIYRSAAIKVVHEAIKEVILFDSLEDNFEAIDALHDVEKRICNDLMNLSSAAGTIEVLNKPYGKWIKEYNGNGWDDFWDYKCSNCGKIYKRADAILYHANYCPNCGIKINEENK